MFCKHDWKILSEVTTSSKLDEYAKVTGKFQPATTLGHFNDMTTRKLILVLTCSKCGKLKRFVETI